MATKQATTQAGPRQGQVPASSAPSGRGAAGRPSPAAHEAEEKKSGWLFLALLPMALCCGGPVLLGALAAASAATLGTIGGVLGGVLILGLLAWWLHRRHLASPCCSPAVERGQQ
jgi:hypothetical protein